MSLDLRRCLTEARQAAWEAGQLIVDRLGHPDHVRYKGPSNPVTEVDLKAQEMIRRRLLGLMPESGFLGEEGQPTHEERDPLWIVDPLDGTKNFAHGYPVVSVSIALEHQGKVVLGLVHDPGRQETFEAIAGEGATLNGRPIRVSDQELLG